MDRLLRVSQTRAFRENHRQDLMILSDDAVVNLEAAEYIDGYRLHLSFSDDKERTVDFEPFLRHSLNPMIRKYLNLDHFKKVTVADGDLFWNDYDLCFPIADLYEGRI